MMRPDLEIIQNWIAPGSRVLDLGCGDGGLLDFLKKNRGIREMGLEIDPANISKCLEFGVNVIEQNLDDGLTNFQSNSFDTVLLTQTLQALSNPDLLIEEMLRVGKNGIVTFPNFGNWKSRFYLSSKGRMPVSKFMPYKWYDTPNIHHCTIRDFDSLCRERTIKILHRTVVDFNHRSSFLMNLHPNLFGINAIYHFTR